MARPIQVILPTYHRPQNLARIKTELIFAGTDAIFVAHHEDEDTITELKALGVKYVVDFAEPSGVNAANRGFQAVTSDWFVLSQDDIIHHEGWLVEAMELAKQYKVIGFNDGSTQHSVAWLINREYVLTEGLSIGHPGVIFNPDYTKNYADNELNDIARSRGVFGYSDKSLCEHMHPGFDKAPMDETYKRLEHNAGKDAELFNSRKHLWS